MFTVNFLKALRHTFHTYRLTVSLAPTLRYGPALGRAALCYTVLLHSRSPKLTHSPSFSLLSTIISSAPPTSLTHPRKQDPWVIAFAPVSSIAPTWSGLGKRWFWSFVMEALDWSIRCINAYQARIWEYTCQTPILLAFVQEPCVAVSKEGKRFTLHIHCFPYTFYSSKLMGFQIWTRFIIAFKEQCGLYPFL